MAQNFRNSAVPEFLYFLTPLPVAQNDMLSEGVSRTTIKGVTCRQGHEPP